MEVGREGQNGGLNCGRYAPRDRGHLRFEQIRAQLQHRWWQRRCKLRRRPSTTHTRIAVGDTQLDSETRCAAGAGGLGGAGRAGAPTLPAGAHRQLHGRDHR
eukprot:3883332-Pleurochrysis_carterae.AAC.1